MCTLLFKMNLKLIYWHKNNECIFKYDDEKKLQVLCGSIITKKVKSVSIAYLLMITKVKQKSLKFLSL